MLQLRYKKKKEAVVLLHGLGRTSRSMQVMEMALRFNGYEVINLDYPSTEETISVLTQDHLKPVVDRLASPGKRIHFVTHSMGGILVRALIKNHDIEGIGRVVMLSPPNHGSEVAEHFNCNPLFINLLGPAGQELGLGAESTPLKLGVADFDLGIICGARTSGPWFSSFFNGPNDGKVSVNSARLPGMNDFLVLPHGHTFIMQQPGVISQVLRYLTRGRFLHSNNRSRLSLPPAFTRPLPGESGSSADFMHQLSTKEGKSAGVSRRRP